jgi:cation transporter-like permease
MEAKESLPSQQLGFRQILADIYAHTSSHIVGAALACYLAIFGSRFRFSHDNVFMPMHALEAILKGTKSMMQMQSLN